ncbi:MAG: PIN domain-containing protein, partial [Actinomycetota bacterium]|nr:PIN domain-containing protein [Actinomycetota bacterium]
MPSPWGDLPLLADTSAWVRNRRPAVREAWEEATDDRRIVTAPPVVFELLYAARDGQDFDRIALRLDRLALLRLTHSALSAARGAMRELAHTGPGAHRVPQPDLLIAAVAQEAG